MNSSGAMADLQAGQHLCSIYESSAERQAALSDLIAGGLERGERILYIAENQEALNALSGQDEVKRGLADGQILFLPSDQVYLQGGSFEPGSVIAFIELQVEQALAAGYAALRIAVDMSWVLQGRPGTEQVIQYEARLNDLLAQSRCLCLCQYDRGRFVPEFLLDLLMTHPRLLLGGACYSSCHYTPPAELEKGLSAARLQRCLENMTRRQQAQQALKTQEQWRLLLTQLPAQVLMLDREGKIIFINRALQKFTVEELTGAYLRECLPPDRFAKAEKALQYVFDKGEPFRYEVPARATDGRNLWYESIFVPLEVDGQVIDAGAITTEITERKLAEETLRDSEERLRQIIEQMPYPAEVYSADGTATMVNQAFLQMFGLASADLVVGKYNVFQDKLTMKELGLEEAIRQVYSGQTVFVPNVVTSMDRIPAQRGARQHGKVIHEVTMFPVLRRSGQLWQVVTIWKDVTGQKLVEEKNRRQAEMLAALHETAVILGSKHDLSELLESIVILATDLVEARAGALFLYRPAQDCLELVFTHNLDPALEGHVFRRGEGLAGRALERQQVLSVTDYSRWEHRIPPLDLTSAAVIALPILWTGNMLGVLQVMADTPRTFSQDDEVLLEQFTPLAAAALENQRLFEAVRQQGEQIRALSGRMSEASEMERKRIAHELHDQVGQNLTALSINLNIISSQLKEGANNPLQSRLEDSLVLIEQTTEQLRSLMAELRPPVLDDYGLVAALRWYVERWKMRTGVSVTFLGSEGSPRLDAAVETGLFRIAQEALNNVAKHAQAGQVTLSVKTDAEQIELGVVDDGQGFDPTAVASPEEHNSWGLLSMRERATGIGGHFQVESCPGKGTWVTVRVPRRG